MIIPIQSANPNLNNFIDENSIWLDIEKIENFNSKTYYYLIFSFDIDISLLNQIDDMIIKIVDESLIPTQEQINNFLIANNLPLENINNIEYFLNYQKITEKKQEIINKKYIFSKSIFAKNFVPQPKPIVKIPIEQSNVSNNYAIYKLNPYNQKSKKIFGETEKFYNKTITNYNLVKYKEKISISSDIINSNSLILEISYLNNTKSKRINFSSILQSFLFKNSDFFAKSTFDNSIIVKSFNNSKIKIDNNISQDTMKNSNTIVNSVEISETLRVKGDFNQVDQFYDVLNKNYKNSNKIFYCTNAINDISIVFKTPINHNWILYRKNRTLKQKNFDIISDIGINKIFNKNLIKNHNYEFQLVDFLSKKVLDTYTIKYKQLSTTYDINFKILESSNDYKFEILTNLPQDKNEELLNEVLGSNISLYESEINNIKKDIQKYFIYKVSRLNLENRELIEMGWTSSIYSDINFSSKLLVDPLPRNCTYLIEGYFVLPDLFLNKKSETKISQNGSTYEFDIQKYLHPTYLENRKIINKDQRSKLYGINEFEYGTLIKEFTIDFTNINADKFSLLSYGSRKVSNFFYEISWLYSGVIDHVLIFKINAFGYKEFITKVLPGNSTYKNYYYYREKNENESNIFSLVFINKNYEIVTEVLTG